MVAGVADPPGPDELQAMVDEVLRGIAGGDFADVTLLRAAAFARVVATGRAACARAATHDEAVHGCCTLAEQLEAAGHARKCVARWPDDARLCRGVRRAVAAPGPKISRYERPRAVRRSRSGALHGFLPAARRPLAGHGAYPRAMSSTARAPGTACDHPAARRDVRPRGRRRAGPRRGRLGLGALRGGPEPGQGPARCCSLEAADGDDWLGLMLTSQDHDRDADDEARYGPALDGRRHRRLGPPSAGPARCGSTG